MDCQVVRPLLTEYLRCQEPSFFLTTEDTKSSRSELHKFIPFTRFACPFTLNSPKERYNRSNRNSGLDQQQITGCYIIGGRLGHQQGELLVCFGGRSIEKASSVSTTPAHILHYPHYRSHAKTWKHSHRNHKQITSSPPPPNI